MMDYLCFRLYGPLASWGEIAVGESRHTAAYPGKAALLGLLAAALGIRRDEEERQTALAAGYQFGVKVISTGNLLRDYHTTQAPDSVGSFVYRTRRDELVVGKERLGTILSSREYRCDALALVAARAWDGAPHTLQELCDAMHKPKFHLYLGRKSCPLAVPLKPSILPDKAGFGQALDDYQPGPLYISSRLLDKALQESEGKSLAETPSLVSLSQDDRYALYTDKHAVCYYWEGESGDHLKAQQILTRHDQPTSRRRWQFTQRPENLFMAKEEG
jgi:CRISPR system Cascade subunit CasD